MAKYPSEIFGYYWKDTSIEAKSAKKNHHCPFHNSVCYKKSRLVDYPFGVCTAHTNGKEIALCPRRFIERGIIFQTWTKKDLHGQLLKNPQVELCYAIKDGSQIRISGKLELVDDIALKKEIEAKRPFMTAFIQQFGGYGVVAIWVLKKGQAQIWTMKENFAPKSYIEI